MDLGHDGTPQFLGKVLLIAGQFDVVVESGPGGCRVVRCITGEPHIVIIGGRTCLTGNRHSTEMNGAAGSDCHYVHHGVGQQECG